MIRTRLILCQGPKKVNCLSSLGTFLVAQEPNYGFRRYFQAILIVNDLVYQYLVKKRIFKKKFQYVCMLTGGDR